MVKIQTVVGAIRATEGIHRSSRNTHAGAKSYRSPGVYVEKNWRDEIELGFHAGGDTWLRNRAEDELAKVIETLNARGLQVITKQKLNWRNVFEPYLVVIEPAE